MHADGLGDGFEIERAEVLDAAGEECILLAHDFVGDFQDGAGALVERAHQPGGALQAFGEVGFFGVAPRRRRDLGIVALVDQHLRQGVGIELDDPAAVGSRPHEDVGHDRLHHRRAERQAGLRIEAADFRDHVGEVFVAHAADFLQRGKIAPRQQIEPGDQGLHRRIVAILLLELDRQAFREIARANTGRIETLQNAEHGPELGDAGTEFFRDRRQVAGQIAGLVDQIDEVIADHAPYRIDDFQGQLLAQPIRQRRFRGHEGFEIEFAVVAAAGADASPFRIAARRVGYALAAGLGLIGGSVVDMVLGPLRFGFAVRRAVAAVPGLAGLGRLVGGLRAVDAGRRLAVGVAGLEQRVALELGVDIGDQVEIGELQQLDGLHQLRRHHQRLALPDLESLGQRHESGVIWSDSCLSAPCTAIFLRCR